MVFKRGFLRKITGVVLKLCHNFSKNILTKLKRYATMVVTSGKRDVERQDFVGLEMRFLKGGVSKIINWWAEIGVIQWQERKLVA